MESVSEVELWRRSGYGMQKLDQPQGLQHKDIDAYDVVNIININVKMG